MTASFLKEMKLLISLILTFSITHAQRRYKIIQEKVVVEYVDQNCLGFEAEVIKFNDTINAINISLTPKIAFHENGKISVRGYKSLNNKYTLLLFRFDKTIKQASQMEAFDVLALRMDYSRPPIVWPLKSGVTYRIVGWNPEPAKFLPNIPWGNWKFRIVGTYPNGTVALKSSWYLRIA